MVVQPLAHEGRELVVRQRPLLPRVDAVGDLLLGRRGRRRRGGLVLEALRLLALARQRGALLRARRLLLLELALHHLAREERGHELRRAAVLHVEGPVVAVLVEEGVRAEEARVRGAGQRDVVGPPVRIQQPQVRGERDRFRRREGHDDGHARDGRGQRLAVGELHVQRHGARRRHLVLQRHVLEPDVPHVHQNARRHADGHRGHDEDVALAPLVLEVVLRRRGLDFQPRVRARAAQHEVERRLVRHGPVLLLLLREELERQARLELLRGARRERRAHRRRLARHEPALLGRHGEALDVVADLQPPRQGAVVVVRHHHVLREGHAPRLVGREDALAEVDRRLREDQHRAQGRRPERGVEGPAPGDELERELEVVRAGRLGREDELERERAVRRDRQRVVLEGRRGAAPRRHGLVVVVARGDVLHARARGRLERRGRRRRAAEGGPRLRGGRGRRLVPGLAGLRVEVGVVRQVQN